MQESKEMPNEETNKYAEAPDSATPLIDEETDQKNVK
jgi:hypothetical protein